MRFKLASSVLVASVLGFLGSRADAKVVSPTINVSGGKCLGTLNGRATYYDIRGPVAISSEMGGFAYEPKLPMIAAAQHVLSKGLLAYGDLVQITNCDNGKVTLAYVTDTGPMYAERGSGRILDLSPRVFRELAPLEQGVINVSVRVVRRYCDPPVSGNKMPNCRIDPKKLPEMIVALNNSLNKGNNPIDFVTRPLDPNNNNLLKSVASRLPSFELTDNISDHFSRISQIKTEIEAWMLKKHYLSEQVQQKSKQVDELEETLSKQSGLILDGLRKSREMSLLRAQAIIEYQSTKVLDYREINHLVNYYNYLTGLNYGIYTGDTGNEFLPKPTYNISRAISTFP